ncbi:MAG: class I SAM-dependent DNA methyltransferase, partial [bacterium]|nr:class I SAM-dependent DNA methyltransferase [bacterium]
PIKARIDANRIFRLHESKDGQELAKKPHQFREHPMDAEKIIIPSVSSENRYYIPIGHLGADLVISNAAFALYDAETWLFGILTSAMHMVWVKTVGGRLKTDYRYSAQLCYNTFPFPKISDSKKQEIADAAEEVLITREYHLGKTLAELYDPDRMPQNLREAHERLDQLVESCYPGYPFANDEARLECLFTMYEQMTASKQ